MKNSLTHLSFQAMLCILVLALSAHCIPRTHRDGDAAAGGTSLHL